MLKEEINSFEKKWTNLKKIIIKEKDLSEVQIKIIEVNLGEYVWEEIEPMLMEIYSPFFEDYPRSSLSFEGVEEYIKNQSKEPIETPHDWFIHCFSVFWGMAVSYLGKKEIEKRLKGLRK